MNGKRTCSLLKSIRCKIAEQNGIEFHTPECTFQGECKGTCPKCEAELRYLAEELDKIRKSGKRIAVAGIAATMIATSAAGCARQPEEYEEFAIPLTKTEEDYPKYEGLTGQVAVLPTPEEETLDGDVAYPEQEPYDDGSTATGAIAAPVVPEFAEAIKMDGRQIFEVLEGIDYRRVDEKWQAYRVLLDVEERYGEYSTENVTVRFYYNESGFVTEAAVFEDAGENCNE